MLTDDCIIALFSTLPYCDLMHMCLVDKHFNQIGKHQLVWLKQIQKFRLFDIQCKMDYRWLYHKMVLWDQQAIMDYADLNNYVDLYTYAKMFLNQEDSIFPHPYYDKMLALQKDKLAILHDTFIEYYDFINDGLLKFDFDDARTYLDYKYNLYLYEQEYYRLNRNCKRCYSTVNMEKIEVIIDKMYSDKRYITDL